jgi:hypothetical protein
MEITGNSIAILTFVFIGAISLAFVWMAFDSYKLNHQK